MLKKIAMIVIFSCLLVFGFYQHKTIAGMVDIKQTDISWSMEDKILGSGDWQADCSINKLSFATGDEIKLRIKLKINSQVFNDLFEQLDGIYLLAFLERLYDAQGHASLMNNNFMSTVLTPTGQPIEYNRVSHAGAGNAVYGVHHDPLGLEAYIKKADIKIEKNLVIIEKTLKAVIKENLSDGYYRLRMDFRPAYENKTGDKNRNEERLSLISTLKIKSIEDNNFPYHTQSLYYQKEYPSPVFRIGTPKPPKMIWSLLSDKISYGVQGILAEEDKQNFKLSPRHNLPEKFIISPGKKLNLEPNFPTISADKFNISVIEKHWPFSVPIELNYESGEFAVEIITPQGKTIDLGKSKFRGKSLIGASSGTSKYKFKFKEYGKYIIKMDGFIEDVWGNHYRGGGTYYLWVAHRLSFATGAKPGMPFQTGDRYPTSVFVHPPFAAKVKIEVSEYINSEIDNVRTWEVEGTASRFGYFYSDEAIVFEHPGEYIAKVDAWYKTEDGRLWMGNQVGSSVVADRNSKIKVTGRKFGLEMTEPEARFNLNYEGLDLRLTNQVTNFLDYAPCTNINVPYNSGDILFISAGLSANGIDAMLFGLSEDGQELRTISDYNVHPYNFPEKIKKQAYFYFSALRPGVVTRTLVADTSAVFRDSYWPTSPAFNAFGRQFNVSEDGDSPDDIYRFMGGVVYKDMVTKKTEYGIYASMGIVIPSGSYANRVVEPFSEPLLTTNGREFYIFEAGAPTQGVIYEQDSKIGIGGMVFPPVQDIKCEKIINYPDGTKIVSTGISDEIGNLKMSPASVVAQQPGVYKVQETCNFGEFSGDVIGTIDGSYNIYVDDQDATKYFAINNPLNRHFGFSPEKGLNIRGSILRGIIDPKITYSIVMPGIVMDEGELLINNNKFSYKFLPEEFNVQFPNYNYIQKYQEEKDGIEAKFAEQLNSPYKGKLSDTVLMTFFLEGWSKSEQKKIYDVITIMLRGEKGFVINYAR